MATVVQPESARRFGSRIGAFISLTKPRIVELLLVETVPTMIVAKRGWPGLWLIVATIIGGALAAGGAHAINMVVDRDIDALMERTRNRPMVTGLIQPAEAMVFAITLEVVAFAFLWWQVNLLSAVLTCSAMLFYVFVYTLWLKRRTEQNIVIGGAAGAVPVLVGWTAVTNSLDWPPLVLFAIIFVWTPPHFWALAIKYRDDYAAAEVPMMPVAHDIRAVGVKIMAYTLLLWALTLAFDPIADMGAIYLVSALVLGAVFTWYSGQVLREGTPAAAMKLFHWSITYVALLFLAIAVDQLV